MHLTADTHIEWLTNSSATHHVTPDASNLSSHSEYAGPDQCMVGDGSRLRISGIGSTYLSTPHTTLKLHHVLHVPTISKNLFAVAQFTKDNSCYFEFHPSHFPIKDMKSKTMLYREQTSNGLYLPLSARVLPLLSSLLKSSSISLAQSIWPP